MQNNLSNLKYLAVEKQKVLNHFLFRFVDKKMTLSKDTKFPYVKKKREGLYQECSTNNKNRATGGSMYDQVYGCVLAWRKFN